MYNFFEECEFTYEQISEKRTRKIKASVLSRIKEERIMKKSTVLRSVMLAATVAAVGAMSLMSSADTVPISEVTAPENDFAVTEEMNVADIFEEETALDKVATYEIGADSSGYKKSDGYTVAFEVNGIVIQIGAGVYSLDGKLFVFEEVEGNDNALKISVLTEDEIGDVQAIDLDAYTYSYSYDNWHDNT